MNLADAPRFLTPLELASEVAQYRYHPNWTLSTFRNPWEGTFLRVVADVPDPENRHQIFQLRINTAIPPMTSRDQFGRWLLWRITAIEARETMQLLRRNGVPLVDVHDFAEPQES